MRVRRRLLQRGCASLGRGRGIGPLLLIEDRRDVADRAWRRDEFADVELDGGRFRLLGGRGNWFGRS